MGLFGKSSPPPMPAPPPPYEPPPPPPSPPETPPDPTEEEARKKKEKQERAIAEKMAGRGSTILTGLLTEKPATSKSKLKKKLGA